MPCNRRQLHSGCSAVLLLLELACLALLLGPLPTPEHLSSSHDTRLTGSLSGLAKLTSTTWLQLPGAAAAQFVDELLPGMYDAGNNWTTLLYGWKSDTGPPARLTGSWDAPIQQQQWWLGKRPLQTNIITWDPPLVDPHPWDPPKPGTFYQLNTLDTSSGNSGYGPDGRISMLYFKRHASCQGIVWVPVNLDTNVGNTAWTWGDWSYTIDTLADPAMTGTCSYHDWFRIRKDPQDQAAARDLLRSWLLPQGTDISWKFLGTCNDQSWRRDDYWGAWKAFSSPVDDSFGPNAVYTGDGKYPSCSTDDQHIDAYSTPDDGSPPGDELLNPLRLQQIRFGWFDAGLDTTQTGIWYSYQNMWYQAAWCPTGSWVGATCTLSTTPMQADVLNTAGMGACAVALPDGVPFITCRTPGGTLLSAADMRPDTPATLVAGIDFFIGRNNRGNQRFGGGDSYQPPVGPVNMGLPDVACNKRAYSPRFGGRCAAPVVQYLAYDEAYHKQEVRSRHGGLPEYGGCLAGGIMRSIGLNVAADGANNAYTNTWSSFWKWWTPPLWPLDAWYNLGNVLGSSTELENFLYNKTKLSSLFVYQDAFKVPITQSPAGCFKIQNVLAGKTTCIEAPPDSNITNLWWPNLQLSLKTCATVKQQCFQVDEDLKTTGSRIMYQGMCVGVMATPLPAGPSLISDAVRLMPCSEGFVRWKQPTPGKFLTITHSGCVGSSPPRECYAGMCSKSGTTYVQAIDTRYVSTVITGLYLLSGRAFYTVVQQSQEWSSYKALRGLWLNSFAASAVDIRAHRTRFVPPGARQGPNTRGRVDGDGLGGCGLTGNQNSAACKYNAKTRLGAVQYTPDTCAAQWLQDTALTGTNTTRGPICYPGSSFLYTHVNYCDQMSSDMRLSDSISGGADKCNMPIGGGSVGDKFVKADDFWSAVVSYEHDPCGWPFMECVADCSLPSDPVGQRGWSIANNGSVLDTTGWPIGCMDYTQSCSNQNIMKDPKVANQIAAIDWRNLTLYSSQLDFSSFHGAPGAAVWYLNLNFNMLGGNLTALAELPDIFPNLRHLGLAHCSAGRFAPEYSWQQAQMPYCHDRWQDGAWIDAPNPACYCSDDDWSAMTIIPAVGKALSLAASAQTSAAQQAGAVAGITHMMYGSIPSSWGRRANGSLAAWHDKLISVNLAGHHTITGDLPAEWYDQTAFPNLLYLKLKGTQIRPTLTGLTWTNASTCNAVRWDDYSTASGSVYDVSQSCTNNACDSCDWWPLRSAAPWYYSPVDCRGVWNWTACNSTCKGSTKFYKFKVIVPAANGGAPCAQPDGSVSQTDATGCPTVDCPVNCDGVWSDWSACNATCADGLQFSTFSVVTPATAGGDACYFTDGTVRNQTCSQWNASCTVTPSPDSCNLATDGVWTYSDCNCTSGSRTATFTPNAGVTRCNDPDITGAQTLACPDSMMANCDGVWVWGNCNATCGGGSETAWFNLTTPAGVCGACSTPNGTIGTTQACNTQACPTSPINCTGNWTGWGTCNATCGGGNQSRTFVVSQPEMYGGATCSPVNGTVEWTACNTAPCPINCTGNWTGWDTCNATCGGGNQSRTFVVTQPEMYGGATCSPVNGTVEWLACNTAPCPINCTGNWTGWGSCNATCGGDNQSRTFVVSQPEMYGGATCSPVNGTVEWMACNTAPCPIDCVGSWAGWGSCNATCGGGNQSRIFVVTQPEMYGGAVCTPLNDTVEWMACNTAPCPINCTGNWTGWGSCNSTCGGGNQSRTFVVSQPEMYGGATCSPLNDTVEWMACNTAPCPIDCVGSWAGWGSCNATCGGGNQSRIFVVTQPERYGGAVCTPLNDTVEWMACNTAPCPINCTGNWTGWDTCNSTCGGGNQSRIFVVSQPEMYGGATCSPLNDTVEWMACNTAPCPINCTGNWTDWDICNATCGGGNQSRVFFTTQEAAYDGTNCTAANETVEWQGCNTQPCPINCTGSWTGWGACNATCGGGNQSRVFDISQDAADGGVNCTAANQTVEWQSCAPNPCPINCTGSWTGWGTCNATCGGGNQSRTYYITQDAAYGGANCSVSNGTLEWQACALNPCPLNCTGNWTDWGPCNATCGAGNQSRVFYIAQDAAYGGANCSSVNATVEWQACSLQPCSVNCTGSWTGWGACNATCGGGNQSREFVVSQAAAYNGTACAAGDGTLDWQSCNPQPCPINCTGSWVPLDLCNATCGGGNQSQVYLITTPAAYGGNNCSTPNDTVMWQPCNIQPCPIDCIGSWGAWGACNKSCGGGQQSRVFTITSPALFSGLACAAGNGSVDWQACNTNACPVNCTGQWSSWSSCNATCGGGTQNRTFTVSVPAAYGGLNCSNSHNQLEQQPCNTQTCPTSPPSPSPTPQLGVCEVPDLLPVLYLPQGTASHSLPTLIMFPSSEAKDAYCPLNATAAAAVCTVQLQAAPVLLAADPASVAPLAQPVVVQLVCTALTALSCKVVLPLGPDDARYEVQLQPPSSTITICTQQLQLEPALAQVVLDSKAPTIDNIQLTVKPTLDVPLFKLVVTFTEPVTWLANTTTSTSSTAATNDTAVLGAGGTSADQTAASTSYSSSRVLLSNAALLNISVVPGSGAVLASGEATNAALAFELWVKSWGGAEAVVEILGPAYQDIAGNRGETDTAFKVPVPGSDLLQRASTLASTATAISATASALSAAAAAATASGAGGTTSLLRSVGHTQFLAMSVSLAVPWLPAEYIQLCAGLEWSNLVTPIDGVMKLTSNSSIYSQQQLQPQRRRQLLSSSNEVTRWLEQHSRAHGSYRPSNEPRNSLDGTIIFSTNGTASNGSLIEGLTNALILTGTSRWPTAYTARELQMSVIALFAVVAAITVLQGAVLGLWRMFRFDTSSLPNIVRFPKPQVVVYTLLMVPVVYGASKLVASPGSSRADWAGGVAAIVVIPLPVLAFWAYVLTTWRRALEAVARGDIKRSTSSILRAYGSGADSLSSRGVAAPDPRRPSATAQRAGATLALLGDGRENPTLVIRDKQPGEDEFEQFFDGGGGSDSDDEDGRSSMPHGGQQRLTAAASSHGRPYRPQAGDVDGHGTATAPTGSSRRPANVSFLPLTADEQQQGRSAPVAAHSVDQWRSPRGAPEAAAEPPEPPLARMQSLPGSANDEEDELAGGRPLGEGVDDEQQSELAAAWQAARAAGHTNSSWGGQATAGTTATNGRGAPRSQGISGKFQLSFSADGSATPAAGSGQQPQPHSSESGHARKHDTWVSGPGAAGPVVAATIMSKQQQREAAAALFLQKHGFLVDDLVGDEQQMAVQRTRWHILLLHVISIVQRCLVAVMFGLYHFSYISATQLALLIIFHAGFICYLIIVRPYASWLLLLSDLLAYLCELTVLAVAVMLQANPAYVTHQQLTHALIACYFFDVAAMIVPEFIRYMVMAWAWVQSRRAQQQEGTGEGTVRTKRVSTAHARQPGRSGALAAGAPARGDGFVVVGKRVSDEEDAAAAKAAASAALMLSGSGGR